VIFKQSLISRDKNIKNLCFVFFKVSNKRSVKAKLETKGNNNTFMHLVLVCYGVILINYFTGTNT